jgi:hypothetical protein
MKYQIRKVESIKIQRATCVVELDDEHFRELGEPYTGNTAEEFAQYLADKDLQELSYEVEDVDIETGDKLRDVANSDMEEYASSAAEGSDIWLQLGEKDEAYYKSGGFRVDEHVESRY